MEKLKPTQVFEHENDDFLLCSTEHLDADGNIFKSTKALVEAMMNRTAKDVAVLFCPECHEGSRLIEWIPSNKAKLKGEHASTPYKGNIKCPHCGHKIVNVKWSVEPTFTYHKVETPQKNEEDFLPFDEVEKMEYVEDRDHPTIYLERYQREGIHVAHCANTGSVTIKTFLKVWPVSDDKLAMEWSAKYASPKTMYGKYWLQKSTERYRIVFNLKTGQTYIMQGIDAFGKRVKNNMLKSRINKISLAANNYNLNMFGFHNEMKDVVLKALAEYHGFENQAAKAMDGKCGAGYVAQLNYFYCVPEQHLQPLFDFCHNCDNEVSKRMVHDMKKALTNNSFEVFPKYMQKRSIKQRLRQNITMSAVYRWLHKFGITDINIMNNIVDNLSREAFRRMHTNMCDDTRHVVAFVKWLIEGRNAESIKTIIINSFENDYWLHDSIRMFEQVMATGIEVDNSGNIKEIHDRIMHEYNKMRFKNRVIQYEKSEQNFEQTVDDYQFVLAEDTDRLYDIGNNLRICVGSYGERAVAKHCTIVTMQKDNSYVACIELRKMHGQWYMNQLKAKFNHTVQDIDPVIKWVASTGIITDDCNDYQRAITHSTGHFDSVERDYHVNNPRLAIPDVPVAPARNIPQQPDNDWDFYDGPF